MKKRGRSSFKKKGQIWIETIIYTLVAFVMIGLVLAFVRPEVQKLQDKAILQQSLALVKDIDNTILTMGGSGNQRLFSVDIKSGSLQIDGLNNKIFFEMESHYLYSEPGTIVKDGNILINSQKKGNAYSVNFTRDYSGIYDITYNGENKTKTISQSATSYNLQITNKGGTVEQKIDFLIS